MATNAEVTVVLGVVAAVAFGIFQMGKQSGLAAIPKSFQPHFGEGKREDYKCLVLVERRGERQVYAGCYGRAMFDELRANFRAAGMRFPYRVVAEFNREIDDI